MMFIILLPFSSSFVDIFEADSELSFSFSRQIKTEFTSKGFSVSCRHVNVTSGDKFTRTPALSKERFQDRGTFDALRKSNN